MDSNFHKEIFLKELSLYNLENVLSIKDVEVIGFDLDHTFLSYNIKNLLDHLYDCFAKYLVIHKNYPEELLLINNESELNRELMTSLAATEILFDIEKGNLIKLDQDKKALVVFHGIKKLTEAEIIEVYKNEAFTQISLENPKANNFFFNFTNFENHFVPLFAFCIHLFDNNKLKNGVKIYKNIVEDIHSAISFNYSLKDNLTNKNKKMSETGYYFPPLVENPTKFITQTLHYKEILERLIKSGKRLYLITNSVYEYTYFLFKCILGEEDFTKFFDIIIMFSKKPSFFNKVLCQKGFFLNLEEDSLNGEEIHHDSIDDNFEKIVKEKIINEGNIHLIEKFYSKLLNKDIDKINFCYIGDHFTNDCLYLTQNNENFKTFLINNYLSQTQVEIHENYSKSWGNYFICEGKYTLMYDAIKKNKLSLLPNVEYIIHLDD